MDYSAKVPKCVTENFLFVDSKQLKDDTSFWGSSIVDSTGILELIDFLEETFGTTIEDEELIPENFDCIKNISDFLEQKVGKNA